MYEAGPSQSEAEILAKRVAVLEGQLAVLQVATADSDERFAGSLHPNDEQYARALHTGDVIHDDIGDSNEDGSSKTSDTSWIPADGWWAGESHTTSRAVAVAESTIASLSSMAQRVAASDSASELRGSLSTAGFGSRLMMSARPQAVSRSVAHVRSLISDGGAGELHEEALCGWPVRSINEWGIMQDRILVLTTRAIWRVNYAQEWGKVEHHSRLSLASVVGVRRRGAQGGGLVLQLAERDGRANPLTELRRCASKRGKFSWPSSPRSGLRADSGGSGGSGGSSPGHGGHAAATSRTFERAYVAVAPGGALDGAHEVAKKQAIAAAMAEVMLAAIEATHRLHHGLSPLVTPPSIALHAVSATSTTTTA